MASLRKALSYSKKRVVPFTRISKKRSKSFVKTVPQQKIVKFVMGDRELFEQGKLNYQLSLVCEEKVQIRHNALEACRQFINKKLDKETNKQYFFQVIPFPHHIQRENKMLTGAGADRMQKGMQLSYGKSSGKAVLAKKGTKIFFLAVGTEKFQKLARKHLNQVKSKLPCKTRIVQEGKN